MEEEKKSVVELLTKINIHSENKKMEHGSGKKDTSWGWETYVAEPIALYLVTYELRVRFGANGSGFNDWIFKRVEVTIEAIK